MIGEQQIKIPATKIGVRRRRQHFELALVEGDGKHLQRGVATIDEHDITRLLFRRRQVLLVNAVTEGRGSRFVEQSKYIQSCNKQLRNIYWTKSI